MSDVGDTIFCSLTESACIGILLGTHVALHELKLTDSGSSDGWETTKPCEEMQMMMGLCYCSPDDVDHDEAT